VKSNIVLFSSKVDFSISSGAEETFGLFLGVVLDVGFCIGFVSISSATDEILGLILGDVVVIVVFG
jgi:hypothetical protein